MTITSCMVALNAALVCAALPVASLAGEFVRDQYWPANSDGVGEFNAQTLATIIDVSVTGRLDRVELFMNARREGFDTLWRVADMRWQIRSVENAFPAPISMPPLATGKIPGSEFVYEPMVKGMVVDVSPANLYLQAGDQFA